MNILINILIVLFFLIILVWLGIKGYEIYKLQGLRGVIVELIVRAENVFEYGMNDDKFNSVFSGIYNKFPSCIKAFISEDRVKDFIQKVFDEIKIALDNKPKNNK